uniref:H15 domain-containing protein n=1 Tax=Oryzias sinensis TaxID=183150 RepID=A0A8C8DQ64_9TELE
SNETQTKNATEKDSTKLALPEVSKRLRQEGHPAGRRSKLVHGVVHLYKHRGGISMAQLKQKLAAEGYDVTKNNRQVKAATNRLVNNEAFVRTTRSASLRLNKKGNKPVLFCRFSKMCTIREQRSAKIQAAQAKKKQKKGS